MMPRRLEHLASKAARPDIKLKYGNKKTDGDAEVNVSNKEGLCEITAKELLCSASIF